MDKLELKHLAPYLPYGLRLTDCDRPMNARMCELIAGRYSGTRKPILRPMSDFDDPKKYSGDHYSFMSELNSEMPNDLQIDRDLEFDIERNCYVHCKYAMQVYDFLFANHFDVFGVIDKGLAIDINTLTDV